MSCRRVASALASGLVNSEFSGASFSGVFDRPGRLELLSAFPARRGTEVHLRVRAGRQTSVVALHYPTSMEPQDFLLDFSTYVSKPKERPQ